MSRSSALLCLVVFTATVGLVVSRRAYSGPPVIQPAIEPPVSSLPAPEQIGPEAQAELKARMGRHGNTMSSLVRAVVLLDRPTIRTLAGRIADDEIIARGDAASKTKKRLALPPAFYEAQDSLRASAEALAGAAALPRSDDRALADDFAAVARSCVSCHSVYLHHKIELLPPSGRP